MTRYGVTIAAALGFVTVAMGAFAAHALKDRLTDYQQDVWNKAVLYQMFHVVALAAAAYLSRSGKMTSVVAAWAFLVGIILFSGSLYALAWTGTTTWGAVTPFGGVAFLIGWFCLAIAALPATPRER